MNTSGALSLHPSALAALRATTGHGMSNWYDSSLYIKVQVHAAKMVHEHGT